jgi:hypothetical protein
MVKCLLPLILVAATGCASAPPFSVLARPFEVRVPVATPVYCRPPVLARPGLPIAALRGESSAADTIRSYAATVVILKGAVRERDAVIAGCGAPPAEKPAGGAGPLVARSQLLVGANEH